MSLFITIVLAVVVAIWIHDAIFGNNEKIKKLMEAAYTEPLRLSR